MPKFTSKQIRDAQKNTDDAKAREQAKGNSADLRRIQAEQRRKARGQG